MKYAIGGIEGQHECTLEADRGSEQYTVTIDGKRHVLSVLDADSDGMDFVLDNEHHHVTYLKGAPLETRMILDGLEMGVMRHTGLDDIVYKNSGGKSEAGANKNALVSPLPGKVISVAVSEGGDVKKDDPVCTVEAMKMQTSIKAHKDGKIATLAVAPGDTISKGFVIADID